MPNIPIEISTATQDAEEALIGAILVEASDGTKDFVVDISCIVSASDFKDELNQQIYKAMLNCSEAPHQINVARKMVELGVLGKYAIAHMSHCISVSPNSMDYIDFAKAVKYYSELRRSGIPVKSRTYSGFDI